MTLMYTYAMSTDRIANPIMVRGVPQAVLDRVKQEAAAELVINGPHGSASDAVRWALGKFIERLGTHGPRPDALPTNGNGPRPEPAVATGGAP